MAAVVNHFLRIRFLRITQRKGKSFTPKNIHQVAGGEYLPQPLVQNWKFLCTRENTISDSSSYQTFTSSCVSSITLLLTIIRHDHQLSSCLFISKPKYLAGPSKRRYHLYKQENNKNGWEFV